VTLSGAQIETLVDTACGEARAMADTADGLRVQRDTMRAQRDQCVGALAQWSDLDVKRIELVAQLARAQSEASGKVSRLWVAGGIVVGFVLGALVGWAVGSI